MGEAPCRSGDVACRRINSVCHQDSSGKACSKGYKEYDRLEVIDDVDLSGVGLGVDSEDENDGGEEENCFMNNTGC